MHIPRVIHQTAPAFDDLPDEIRANIERIKGMNRGWDYRFSDNASQRAYIEEHLGPGIEQLCERVNPRYQVVVSDLFKYLVIYREGGVYLDIKSTVTRPLDDVLLPDDVFLLSHWRNKLFQPYMGWGIWRPEVLRIKGGEFQQWFIVGAPSHPFLAQVITDVRRNMDQYHPSWFGLGKPGILRVSGPVCYSLAIAPLLHRYRHRLVDIESLGFRYTIYRDKLGHARHPHHYMHFKEPVMVEAERNPDANDCFCS